MRTGVFFACAACAAPALQATEWRSQPPAAPCELHVVETDGMGDWQRVVRFDGDGHPVFGTTRLTYDGEGFEHLTWRGGRLVAVESAYDQKARRGACEVLGGCDEPARRTLEHTRYEYRGDRLVAEAHEERTFGPRGDGWVEIGDKHGGTHYEYNGDHLVHRGTGDTQRFELDSSGRLAREVLEPRDPRTYGPKTTEWTYDDAGRLARTLATQHYASGVEEHHEWRYTYDDAGRLAREDLDGTHKVYTYSAGCPRDLEHPTLPTPLLRARLAPCIVTPGATVATCD